ncbi:MAG: tetratricopeptide repeat protein [Massilia sp.]|nr:tetratricopeptide repeat protein [Massilia sp.]
MRAPRKNTLARGAATALLLACACARAQQTPADTEDLQQKLYQQAMQSLAEGRKEDASAELLELVAREPLHAGAWVEVALIQCELGHADVAERLFATVETRFNPSRDILEVIANARETGCKHWQPTSSLSLSLGRGADQNVNQGASTSTFLVERGGTIELPLLPDFLPKRDQYSVLSASYTRDVSANGSSGFAQVQLRRNDTLNQYDSAALFAGIESPYRLGRWTMRTTGMLGLVSLGGRAYQRQVVAQARVVPPLTLPYHAQFNLMGGVTHTEYLTLSNFNSNTGELRGQLWYRKDDLFASASVGYLNDHAIGQRPGGDRSGTVSSLFARRRIGAGLTGELGYTRQTWNSALPYSPELLIDQVRAQATQLVRAALTYPLSAGHSLQLEVRAVRNRENISIFQYNNRQLQLSWNWQQP